MRNSQIEIASSTESWETHDSLSIHKKLYEKGLVVVRPESLDAGIAAPHNVNTHTFFIKERMFYIGQETDKFLPSGLKVRERPAVTAAAASSSPSGVASSSREGEVNLVSAKPANVKKVKAVANRLITVGNNKKTNIQPLAENSVIIFNSERRDEMFFPFVFTGEKPAGMYIYPWVEGGNLNAEYRGSSVFVTAGCMIGASLKGLDSKDNSKPIIKHDVDFYADQQIIDIYCEKNSAYDKMLEHQFKMNLKLMQSLSNPSSTKFTIYYHLPYIDYWLFGIEIYLQRKISGKALEKFFKVVYEKKLEHERKIKAACREYNVDLHVLSPFDNLFDVAHINRGQIASMILALTKDTEGRDDFNEVNVVRRIIHALRTNSYDSELQQVWRDLLSVRVDPNSHETVEDEMLTPPKNVESNDNQGGEKDKENRKKPTAIERLFQLANAAVIARASRNRHRFDVCSLLPLSEKQIQISYDKLQKSLKTSQPNIYPATLNISHMEPVITYYPAAQGLLFYYSPGQNDLASLLDKNGFLKNAYQNVGLFASKKAATQKQVTAYPLTVNSVIRDKFDFLVTDNTNTCDVMRPASCPNLSVVGVSPSGEIPNSLEAFAQHVGSPTGTTTGCERTTSCEQVVGEDGAMSGGSPKATDNESPDDPSSPALKS